MDGTLCFNNPDYRNWLLAVVEDYSRSHEIDGIMWGSERQGAFSNALGASLDIDIPTAATSSKSTPEGTTDAVLAAFRAGSDGVILSRKYSEMKLANLRGAGAAIRELRLA